ncbi:dr1-associated corepressor [Cimex lectularius]|uniref:Transcription factor CBF/NF-Y/archaeal histone domain-containing protein n=1 Tax=Cimex lectularius TaxID=79782 RepID=A0A8I6RMR7_CIMLE|nr:dr1-associated corepressor [Cimex lectularius]XP_014248053.1 dr1-associated corepressor [Cimex lectularius]
MPSKKKYNARFPIGRIKRIIQTDEEVGKVALAVPIIISRTLELFVESLIKKSMKITIQKNARTLSPHHMKQCILSESRFDFLRDLVRNLPEASTSDDDGNWNSNENWGSNSQEQRRESSDDPSELKMDEDENKSEKQEENAPKAMNFYKEIDYTNNGNGSSNAMNESDEDDYDS